ncbi:MAG TPA: hypothetical protein VHY35_09080 [Stellaceae bacterium]|jgi:hypothetical protein|nr:hypothetical protein [Stellaceae bacterium]
MSKPENAGGKQAAGAKARAQQGLLTSQLAAGGVDINSGSNEDTRKTQEMTGELD